MTACHNAVDFDEVMAFTSACRHEPQRPRAAQEMNFQVAVVAPTRITVKLSKFLSLPNPSQSSHLSGLWKWSMGVVMCYAYMYNIYIYTDMYKYVYIYMCVYHTHVLFFWAIYIYLPVALRKCGKNWRLGTNQPLDTVHLIPGSEAVIRRTSCGKK